MKDDNNKPVSAGAGDTIHFSYGIPPVPVVAKIIERDGELICLCPGHNPPEIKLSSLRKHVGAWYKVEDK